MNIAIFARSTTYHFISGGMETHLKNLAEGLAEKSHKVHIITTAHPESLSQNFNIIENGVEYHFIGDTIPGLNPPFLWEKFFINLKLLKINAPKGNADFFVESYKQFKSLDKEIKFDIAISQSTGGYGAFENISIPRISIIHGTIKTEIINRWRSLKTLKNYLRFFAVDVVKWAYEFVIKNKKFFEKCDKVIAVSEQLKNDFIDDFSDLKSKIVVIPNGVDEKIFTVGTESDKNKIFTLLYIGRMDLEKGIDTLISAVNEIKYMEVQAHLIGGGVHVNIFKEMVEELGLQDKIKFLGQVENSKLPEYYKQSHVFVLPSKRAEGHPMTISEAMCSGLPLLTTKSGGLKDLYTDEIEGFFIYDHISLAEKINILVKDRPLLLKMSEASHLKGAQDYSKNAMIDKYIFCLSNIK
jgi:glycosyltransferase involved in cell wall biosynthesis